MTHICKNRRKKREFWKKICDGKKSEWPTKSEDFIFRTGVFLTRAAELERFTFLGITEIQLRAPTPWNPSHITSIVSREVQASPFSKSSTPRFLKTKHFAPFQIRQLWKFYVFLAPLGIIGGQLRHPLKPSGASHQYCTEGFKWAPNWGPKGVSPWEGRWKKFQSLNEAGGSLSPAALQNLQKFFNWRLQILRSRLRRKRRGDFKNDRGIGNFLKIPIEMCYTWGYFYVDFSYINTYHQCLWKTLQHVIVICITRTCYNVLQEHATG